MIDSKTIPKYTSNLDILPVFKPIYEYDCTLNKYIPTYKVDIIKTEVQMLPDDYPKTTVYAYGGIVYSNDDTEEYVSSTPGPSFVVEKNEAISVEWRNKIDDEHILPVDPTLHWANPNNFIVPPKPWPPFPPGFIEAQFPVPTVTHLHGGETEAKYDGFPDSWFTFNGITGPAYETNVYRYLNQQQSTNLFYHDHALGITRLNVYAGLSGAYIIKDPCNILDCDDCSPLPQGKYDIALIIQDKSFNEDGSLYFPANGINSDTHPYWRPAFFGNTNVVNGRVWPNLNVKKKPYRFRIVNSANSRFYTFKLSNNEDFIIIGTDSGYVEKPIYVDEITLAPAERIDVIIDFSKFKNKKVLLLNVNEDSPLDKETTGQVMQFKIEKCKDNCCPLELPCKLNNIPKLQETVSKRVVVLNASLNASGLEALLLNGQTWHAPVSEKPLVGSTQVWEIVNITGGAHPIHIHLVSFQVLNRQAMDITAYANDFNAINGPYPLKHPTKIIDPNTYLIGKPTKPTPSECGWKDTVIAYPGEVTRIIVPMFPNTKNPKDAKPGDNLFPFNPSEFPGYVWHCHLLDHEDNEMMRPMEVITKLCE